MTLSSASKLYIVELVTYAILGPLTIYLLYRHGKHGLLGYFYLSTYCVLRIVTDIINLLPSNRDPTPGNVTLGPAVLSAVGLSPLLLGLSGFLHEAHVYLLHATAQSYHQEKRTKRWLWFIQLQVHTVCWAGMALIIAGSVKLAGSSNALTTSERNSALTLRKVGMVLLLLLLASLAVYAVFLTTLSRRAASVPRGFTPLLGGLLTSIPFLAIRDVFAAVSVFDPNNNNLNSVTGALWVKVIFIVLAPMIAVLLWCLGGWMSRNIARQIFPSKHSSQGRQSDLLIGNMGSNSDTEQQADQDKYTGRANEQTPFVSPR